MSIPVLDSWHPEQLRSFAASIVGGATQINSLSGEFTGATALGAVWRGQASDAMQTSAQALAVSLGETATTFQKLAKDLDYFAASIESAKVVIAEMKSLVNDHARLPLELLPDGTFDKGPMDELKTLLDKPLESTIKMAIQYRGWPPDILDNFSEYVATVELAENKIQETFRQLEQTDAKVAPSVRECAVAIREVATRPTNAALLDRPRLAAAPGQPWVIVGNPTPTKAEEFDLPAPEPVYLAGGIGGRALAPLLKSMGMNVRSGASKANELIETAARSKTADAVAYLNQLDSSSLIDEKDVEVTEETESKVIYESKESSGEVVIDSPNENSLPPGTRNSIKKQLGLQ